MKFASMRHLRPVTAALALSLALASPAWASGSAKEILQRFVEDYRSDPMLVETTFGVDVAGERYHVVSKMSESGETAVTLHDGFPEGETWYFTLDDMSVLHRLDGRTLNAGTAMAKAFSTDETPMDIANTEDFRPGEGFLNEILKVTFHFWNRGFPELIPFNDQVTRFTHGTDAVIFYYQPGFRSGWFSIKQGHHVNADPNSRTNPFPSLMVFTRGKGTALIGDEKVTVQEGQALFIPPEISHQFFNENEAPLQGVLLMFGEEA